MKRKNLTTLCEKCGHKKTCFTNGFCHYSEPGNHGVYCGCKCTFPDVLDARVDEIEQGEIE